MLRNFSTDCKILKVQGPTVAGTTDVTSDAVDMAQDGGYRNVCFLGSFGTAAAGNKPHAQQSSVVDGTGDAYADLEGSEIAPGASDEVAYLDVIEPEERFVRAVFARGTSSTLGDVYAILYGARNRPVDNTVAGTSHGELHYRPAEGTK